MANRAEQGAMESAASDSATSWGAESATQEAAGMHTGSIGQGRVSVLGTSSTNGPYPSYHGRKISWVAVAIMVLGFLVGGLALVYGSHGPTWWLFWIGSGIAVVGLLTSLATNTFDDWY